MGAGITTFPEPFNNVASSTVTCTVADTAYQVSTSTGVRAVMIAADEGNTGNVIMGDSTITTAGVGVPKPSTAPTKIIPLQDLRKLYVASSVGGDVVRVLIFT